MTPKTLAAILCILAFTTATATFAFGLSFWVLIIAVLELIAAASMAVAIS